MKDKIMMFIIGLLLGAVITAGFFLYYEKTHKTETTVESPGQMQMMEKPDGEPPARPEGEDESTTERKAPTGDQDNSTRPEKPSNTSSNQNQKTEQE